MLDKGLKYQDAAMINVGYVMVRYMRYLRDGYVCQMHLYDECSFLKLVVCRWFTVLGVEESLFKVITGRASWISCRGLGLQSV
jgi:hypothetical protein